MGMPVNTPRTWHFGVFELEASTGELRRSGVVIKLREQPARILVLLLEHAGQMVTRGQLHQHLVLFNHIALDHDVVFLEHIPHLKGHFVVPAEVSGGFYKTPQEPGASSDLMPAGNGGR